MIQIGSVVHFDNSLIRVVSFDLEDSVFSGVEVDMEWLPMSIHTIHHLPIAGIKEFVGNCYWLD